MKTIQDFVGSVLEGVHVDDESATLSTNQGVIVLNNRLITAVTPFTAEATPIPNRIAPSIVITKIDIVDEESITFLLSDGREIRMSLADNDYQGPEAAEFYFDSGEIIVIN